ncbi:MAG: STM4015 family protein [Candidatus Eremiobacteraeota bacterium]|nr:STM4015 family protein [Candidatus Eremiobacteraeota bacterium]MCW5872728.1 STM4015 family protein [Candidatus Eremiobacteraeota bacterium]
MRRELIYMDAKSSKFWNIQLAGSSHTVTYGRIGSAGQSATKNFASEELARKDAEKLIKEKLGKGYVEAAAETPQAGQLLAVAFPSVIHKDEIQRNVGTFVGQRVVDYDPEKPARSDVAYRFRSDYENDALLENLEHFAQTEAAAQCSALVIGAWQGDDSGTDSSQVIAALVAHKARFPRLVALYLGDITYEENEMSWIQQSDLSPLLEAYPQLQLLRTRGGEGLEISRPRHAKLRALAMETGGMNAALVQSLGRAEFPNLEYLELWLGTEDYGGTVTTEDLQPILAGTLFPKLKYLGLRNSDQADAMAQAVVTAPLLQQLETLDLSLGTLSDEGARALLQIKAPLKRLNLHHNYISPELVRQLKELPLSLDATNPSGMEADDERYVAVGE